MGDDRHGRARRIGAVAIWASDLERSAAFYRDVVGVPLVYSDPHEPENRPHYETMWNGDGRVLDELDWSREGPSDPALWFNIYEGADRPTRRLELSLPVPDLDAVLQRATAAGARVVSGPAPNTFGPGQWAAIEDPDGNRVVVSS